MSGEDPAGEDFVEGLARALAEDGGALLATGVLGGLGPIDAVARLAGGRVAVVIDARDDPLAALGRALVERDWLAPRVADWARLAPERDLRPGRGAAALLAAERLPDALVAAAAERGVGLLELVRVDGRWRRPETGSRRTPPVARPEPPPPGRPPRVSPEERPVTTPLRSVFRSGLRS